MAPSFSGRSCLIDENGVAWTRLRRAWIRLMTWSCSCHRPKKSARKSSQKRQDFRLHWCWIRHHPVHDHAGGGDGASCVRQSQNLSHRNRIVDRPLPKCPQKNHRQEAVSAEGAGSGSGSSISLTFTT